MKLRFWLRALFRRSATEAELQRELQSHLEHEAASLGRDGLTPDEARAAALRSFGGVGQVQEECRDAWGVRFLDGLKQDLG